MANGTQYPELLEQHDRGEYMDLTYGTKPKPTRVRIWYRGKLGFVRNPRSGNKDWFVRGTDNEVHTRAKYGLPPASSEPDVRSPVQRWSHSETVRRPGGGLRLEAALDAYKTFTGVGMNREAFRAALVEYGVLVAPVPGEPGKLMLAGTVLAADAEG